MSQFIVFGGEYVNTDFQECIEGTYEEHGPFNTRKEALDVWNSRSWATVDKCNCRFGIVDIEIEEVGFKL